jgi:peroxiredoxin
MAAQNTLPRRQFLTWLAASSPLISWAQGAASSAALAELQGTTPGGSRVSLEALRGRVVLVFYWATDCPVCHSKMPELRANAAGWQGRNFTLLGVNMDQKLADFLRYEEVVSPLLPAAQKFSSVWGRDPAYQDNLGPVTHLPSAILIDTAGRVVERYSGRIPAQAWDRIADLL